MTEQGLRRRSDAIIAVVEDYRERFTDATDNEILECVEDCTGWNLSDREKRLAIQVYDVGREVAKRGPWYT